MSAWYVSRTYYLVSGISAFAISLAFMVSILISDGLPSCKDPYGISERCFSSNDCLEDHCTQMQCGSMRKCVPVVSHDCTLANYIISPYSCPLYKGIYQPAANVGCIAFLVLDLCQFLILRLYIRCRRNRTYEHYPSIARLEEQCPECGQDIEHIYEKCTACGGTGLYTGASSAIACHACRGKGRSLKIQGL